MSICSIEGSTIIIAACIPILKPLLDYARAGCSQATASVCGGFSSRYRGVSGGGGPGPKGGTHGPQQPQDEDAGNDLFRLGTRTGVVIVGSATQGPTGPTRPPGARLRKSSFHNFSHLHHYGSRRDQDDSAKRGGPDKDGMALCSTSSQDSILQHTRASSEDAADTDVSMARTTQEPGDELHGRNHHHSSAKRFDVEHGGIMRTDSVEISFKPASIRGGGGDHATAV